MVQENGVRKGLTLVLWCLVVPCLGATPKDLDTVRQRLLANYLTVGTSAAAGYLRTEADDGTWPDIDYRDQSRVLWKPAAHFDRLAVLAAAYRQPPSPLFARGEVLDAVHRGLQAWFRLGLKADNWWFNTIGIPQKAMRVLVLVDRDLAPEDRTGLLALLPDPDHVPPAVATGQNLVWHASEQLVRGVMKPDPADVAAASSFLQKDLRLSLGEGIQPDGSFHQHGWQLYNGGYGFGFATDSVENAALLDGTEWAFSPSSLAVLGFYWLEGQRKMVRGAWFDEAARGREPSRPRTGATAKALAPAAARLAALVPDRAADLRALADGLRAGPGPDGLPRALWTGDQAFWRSDFLTHSRPGWYASVKMASGRSIGTEAVNGENLGGYWQSFGALRIVCRGDENADLWAVWDGARVPGTTTPHRLPPVTRAVSQAPVFVGAVSDGRRGLAAMVVDKDGLRARKAWFLFDEGVEAWGTGIGDPGPDPVATTVNQTLARGPVVVEGDPSRPRWVLHDGVAYLFDGRTPVAAISGTRTGSWRSVNRDQSPDPVTKPVFTLTIDHGTAPSEAGYRYTVLPGAGADEARRWTDSPPVTGTADGRVDTVYDRRDGTWAAVFWRPGTAVLPGFRVTADRPCLVLGDGVGRVTAADPAQGTGRLTLVRDTAERTQTLVLDLPAGNGFEGAAVTGRWP